MSTAMRSTLQTVPESLEVTKTSTTTQDAPATASTKTPAKATGEAVATKSSRSYNYHAPSSTNKPITIKNQMMRLLRRSKSTAAAHIDKTSVAKTPPGHHQPHHHYHHNHVVHPQHNRNGGMVVNMVEGVPLVVGGGLGGKSKKFLVETDLENPFWKLTHEILGFKKVTVNTLTCDLDLKNYVELKKMREEKFLRMQEKLRIFIPGARSL